MESKPDLIKIYSEVTASIKATTAEFLVRIDGESFFTGNTAYKKSKEVASLVQALSEMAGIEEDKVFLQSVRAEKSTGIVGRSSKAIYVLKVVCEDLDDVGNALGAITSRKNAKLASVKWNFDESEETREKWLIAALEKAAQKAEKVARALNVKITGVHSFGEKYISTDMQLSGSYAGEGAARVKSKRGLAARVTSESLGLQVQHEKEVTMAVEVEFRVSQ